MRRLMCAFALLGAAPTAMAAEVVFLTDVADSQVRAAIEQAAEARQSNLGAADLLAASGQMLVADRSAYEALEKTLKDVRAYETRLDGELIIMSDLGRGLADIKYVASQADRDRLFAALTYQGFAVHRFFEETLGEDERGIDYRIDLNGLSHVKPWAHALALEPERDISPYEVAEAPQRIAYTEQKARYGSEALPGTLLVDDKGWFSQGASLVIDGRPVEGTDHKLLPGMHWAHVVLDGRVLDATSMSIDPGQTSSWTLPQAPNAWRSWIRSVDGGQLPMPDAAVKEDVRALGGEVWFVVDGKKGPTIHALSVDSGGEAAWRDVDMPGSLPRGGGGDDSDEGGLSFAVGLGGGWVYSGDFYTQDPINVSREVETVNAPSVDLDVHGAYDIGMLRITAGVHTAFTVGEDHVALTGDMATRFRPYMYVGAGLPWAQMSIGYILPYHPALGPQVTIPLLDGLEARGSFIVGLPSNLDPNIGSDYKTQVYTTLTAGIAYRFK